MKRIILSAIASVSLVAALYGTMPTTTARTGTCSTVKSQLVRSGNFRKDAIPTLLNLAGCANRTYCDAQALKITAVLIAEDWNMATDDGSAFGGIVQLQRSTGCAMTKTGTYTEF